MEWGEREKRDGCATYINSVCIWNESGRGSSGTENLLKFELDLCSHAMAVLKIRKQ